MSLSQPPSAWPSQVVACRQVLLSQIIIILCLRQAGEIATPYSPIGKIASGRVSSRQDHCESPAGQGEWAGRQDCHAILPHRQDHLQASSKVRYRDTRCCMAWQPVIPPVNKEAFNKLQWLAHMQPISISTTCLQDLWREEKQHLLGHYFPISHDSHMSRFHTSVHSCGSLQCCPPVQLHSRFHTPHTSGDFDSDLTAVPVVALLHWCRDIHFILNGIL